MADTSQTHSNAAIALLRANLGFFNSEIPAPLDDYLFSLLGKALSDFSDMGISLQPGVLSDDFDQATYAAWLYRNGVTGAGKNEMLKNIIRNRQVNQAVGRTEDSA